MFVQRHGESEANEQRVYSCVKLDPSIIPKGRAHIESLLPYYSNLDIKTIITSWFITVTGHLEFMLLTIQVYWKESSGNY
jgi:hypothetical protein